MALFARVALRVNAHRMFHIAPVASKHVATSSLSMMTIRRLPPSRSFRSSVMCRVEYRASELSTDTYHRLSDHTLEHMVESLEAIGDDTSLEGYDVEYAQGVLTLRLGEHGTYVVNKQPPNKQIWLSSPTSGPKRYDYDLGQHKWFYHRDNHTLDELLNAELSDIMKQPVDLLAGMAEPK